MVRRISKHRIEKALDQLLFHRDLVVVEPYKGGGANGRSYGEPVSIARAQIIDDVTLIRDQYDAETSTTAIVYLERSALVDIPTPETRVMIWAGTPDEREAHVERCGRYQHPEIADLLEVRLA